MKMKFRLVEENELEKRAKYHRKRQKGMSPFYSPNGGNVPLNISRFNASTAEGANGLCEDLGASDFNGYNYKFQIISGPNWMVTGACADNDIIRAYIKTKRFGSGVYWYLCKSEDDYQNFKSQASKNIDPRNILPLQPFNINDCYSIQLDDGEMYGSEEAIINHLIASGLPVSSEKDSMGNYIVTGSAKKRYISIIDKYNRTHKTKVGYNFNTDPWTISLVKSFNEDMQLNEYFSELTTASEIQNAMDDIIHQYEAGELSEDSHNFLLGLLQHRAKELGFYDGPTVGSVPRNSFMKEDFDFNPLKEILLKTIEYLWDEGFTFPSDKFLADDWMNLKDGVETGVDDTTEVAENLVDYLKDLFDDIPDRLFTDTKKYYDAILRYLPGSVPVEYNNRKWAELESLEEDTSDVDSEEDYFVNLSEKDPFISPDDMKGKLTELGYNTKFIKDVLNKADLKEDTVKNSDGTWSNKGDEGSHGKFRTKKQADSQRKAMYANGYKESLKESIDEASLEKELGELFKENDLWVEDYSVHNGEVYVHISDGDWKHDHLRCKWLVNQFLDDKGLITKDYIEKEIGNSDSDTYSAEHIWYITDEDDTINDVSEPLEFTLR